ncbi:M14 family metallopeptidase [soil metagenome]
MIDPNVRSAVPATLRLKRVASLLPFLVFGAFVLAPADGNAQQTGSVQDRQSAVLRSATPALAPAPDPVPGGVPHPAHVFGFHPGDDYELADLGQLEDYYGQLAAASPRVQRIEIGRTYRDNPIHLLFISSEENLGQLDRWRDIARRLARAHDVDEAEARQLAEEGKAIVWIDNGLHSTEVAHAQHGPLLAWYMATDESAETRRIRDDVILLLVPQMNPDGHEVVVNWYRENLGTDWETTGPPEVYHEYVGHDINRDWFMFRQEESRAIAQQLYETWYPQIVFNHHQTAPFPGRIFIPPFADPVNPHIPPLVVRGVNMVGEHMAKRLEERQLPGVVSRMSFTMWWNGGMRTAPYFHNMVGLLSEVGHASATPQYHDPESLPEAFGSGSHRISAKEPSVYYANPWEGGWATLADAVAYHFETSLGALDIGSRLRQDWLFNIWQLGKWQIEAGQEGGPFAYVVDVAAQRDAGEAVELLNVLRRGGVEVHRATAPFRAEGADGARDSHTGNSIAYVGQAFRVHLMDLLERHDHPNREQYPGGPPEPPYGGLSGWTISMAMGVDVHRIEAPFEVRGEAVDVVPVPAPEFAEGGWGWALPATRNDSRLAVNRLLAAGAAVHRNHARTPELGDLGAPGAFLVERGGGATPEFMRSLTDALGLAPAGLASAPSDALAAGDVERLRAPRLGLYMPWTANMYEGWTRYVLREFEFQVDTLRNADIRGDLSAYDVILFADQGAGSIVSGHSEGSRPPGFTGGVGNEGMANLRGWVEAGGTLIAFDGASDFAIQALALPVRNATTGLSNSEFFIPGSLLRTEFDGAHPVAFGMPDEGAAFFQGSRGFEVTDPARATAVASYAASDLLMSGWELGGDAHLAGRAAVVHAPVGSGSAVLIGFRPQFRAQPTGTYKLFFNAIHGAGVP